MVGLSWSGSGEGLGGESPRGLLDKAGFGNGTVKRRGGRQVCLKGMGGVLGQAIAKGLGIAGQGS